MNIDQTTFQDIGIFHGEEAQSIFHRLDCTQTLTGRYWLEKYFTTPLQTLEQIQGVQLTLKGISTVLDQWPQQISNGTIMVMEKFYESPIDTLPASPSALNAWQYQWFHGPDYALVRYSITHFADFVQGLQALTSLLEPLNVSPQAQGYVERIKTLLNVSALKPLQQLPKGQKPGPIRTLEHGHFLRYSFRAACQELIDLYGKLDAWYSMAMAMRKFGLSFPELVDSEAPILEAKGLHHLLLASPVSYDLQLDPEQHFLFLTGANMAGKSTFIKSIGAAVYLAHIGMGVPASRLRLSVFDGILSNINVTDNVVKGESYFFNEVQRIRNTILKINDGRKWLVLIDELFKGTNVQDAMKCSMTVIRGLLKMRGSLFVLSTHLYEMGADLQNEAHIQFRYFETRVEDDQLYFSYQLKEGISNDRLGYLILKREKVVELLEKL